MSGEYSEPAVKVVAVTASDSTDLTGARALYIGGSGDVHVRTVGDPTNTVVISGVAAGSVLPVRVTRVMAATTATDITAFF